MKKIERCARFFYKVIFGNTPYLQEIIRQRAHSRQVLLNKIGFIKNRDIWMKNKKKPFCEHAQRTDAYVTGEQKGFDAVIRQIAHF